MDESSFLAKLIFLEVFYCPDRQKLQKLALSVSDSVVGFDQIQVNIGSVRLAVQFLVGFGDVFWVSALCFGPAGFSFLGIPVGRIVQSLSLHDDDALKEKSSCIERVDPNQPLPSSSPVPITPSFTGASTYGVVTIDLCERLLQSVLFIFVRDRDEGKGGLDEVVVLIVDSCGCSGTVVVAIVSGDYALWCAAAVMVEMGGVGGRGVCSGGGVSVMCLGCINCGYRGGDVPTVVGIVVLAVVTRGGFCGILWLWQGVMVVAV
ncbi:Hypothetical predicted protein [Olea europaea subsp. europaea]|uniref:Uncharacterized protein n=1 Tax=Olea europaea subsp. europaea TaxID=158383 RepID=A0A8S0V0B2_OLEEU|nr:Hypothetical predicted protein [Olea europaea subsp. europaea]